MALPGVLKSKPPPGYTQKRTEIFLHIIWRCFSKSPLVHWGMLGFHFLALSYSPGCWFCQRHNRVRSLVTTGSVQKLDSGRDRELQPTEPAETFLLSQWNVQHSAGWVFLSAAGLNWQRSTRVHRIRILLVCRITGRECRADKVLQGRTFFFFF